MGWLIQAGLVLVAAVVGVVVPLQAGVNNELSRSLGHPLWATLASLLGSVAVTLAALAVVRAPLPGVAATAEAPAWAWSGGPLGATLLVVALLVAPRLGAAGMMAAMVAGQMVASLLLDQFAIAGYSARPITLWRLAGAALVVAGVLAMQVAPRE
jgi:transporter family-2 protein